MEIVFEYKEALWIGFSVVFFLILYFSIFRKNLFDVLFLSILAILISLIVSNPLLKKGYKVLYKEDTDVAILLDHSLSMAVSDIKPNRFEAGRKKILKLIDMLKGLRIGIVVFADKGEIISYPQEDVEKLKNVITSLNIPLKGSTNILEGLSISNSILSGKENITILVSDGGDEDIKKILELAKRMKTRVVYYGIGTEKGGTVPGFKAISKLNTEITKISEITKGISVFYTEDDSDIRKIYSFIKGISKKTRKEILKIPDYIHISPFIAVFTLAVVFLRFFLRKILFVLILFPFVSYGGEITGYIFYMFGEYQKAGEEFLEDKRPENLYNASVSFIKGGFYDKALNILKNIKTDDLNLKKKIKYNTAYIYTLKRRYYKAHEILEELYQLFPEDEKIKKLYLFTNLIVNLNQKNQKKETVVKIKEEKKKENPKSQGEVGTKNPW